MAQLADAVQGFVSLLARLMIAAIFLASAIGNKIPQFTETAAYMASEGVPNPKFALFGAIGLLLIGGVSLILGAWTRFGAIFLLVFLRWPPSTSTTSGSSPTPASGSCRRSSS